MHNPLPEDSPEKQNSINTISEPSKDAENICIIITKQEMRSSAVGRVVDELMNLSDSRTSADQFVHGLHLVFPDHKTASNFLPMTPEIRPHIQAIHAQWPYWMHFLAPTPSLWATLVHCLLRSSRVEGRPGVATSLRYDRAELVDLLSSMSAGLNLLHDHINISDEKSDVIFNGSMRAIETAINPPWNVRHG